MCSKLRYYAITFSIKYFFFSPMLLRNWTTGKTNSVQMGPIPAPPELTVKSPISFNKPHRKQMNYAFIYNWDSYNSETQYKTCKCQ